MYQGKTFIAIIPARGGSVGIPKKNIYPLNGKPLIKYTVEAAEQSKFIDAIYCSTNSDEIANVVMDNSTCKIIKRPETLSTATSKSIDSLVHATEYLFHIGDPFDYAILLQPTSPFRTSEDIDGFIRYIVDNNLPSCVSVSLQDKLPVLMRYFKDELLIKPDLENVISGYGTVRRQDAKKTYYVDGCLYAYKTSDILTKRSDISMNDSPYGYIIDKTHSLDINEPNDILFAEFLLNHNGNK